MRFLFEKTTLWSILPTKKKARDKIEHKKDARENDRRHAQRRPRPRFADTNTTKRVAALNDDDEPREGGAQKKKKKKNKTPPI